METCEDLWSKEMGGKGLHVPFIADGLSTYMRAYFTLSEFILLDVFLLRNILLIFQTFIYVFCMKNTAHTAPTSIAVHLFK